ncbi:MAG: RNA polymerase sigma factor region1.1 domain-containing protein, partial [Desulfohalobiaceae bacterium]
MSNIKDIQQIKTLIAEGKKKGFLTFDEVNKSLPSEVNNPEQVEEIITIFDQLDITIIDTRNGKALEIGSRDTADSGDDDFQIEQDDEVDYASRSSDPVRMYLREMGSVPLLDREGEVRIAKKIEAGEMEVLFSMVEVPVAVEELVKVGEELKRGNMKLKDVVKTIEEDDPSEEEMNQRQRVIMLLDELKQIYRKKKAIYHKLDDCATLERRVWGQQKRILDYKEDVVRRLRDIKLEKTLIDRIIETIGDYVRQMHNCQRDLSAYILSVGKSQSDIQDVFDKLDKREINPVV